MNQKNLIIICITVIICVAILSVSFLLLNNQTGTQNNSSSNDSINITLNDTNNTNNTTNTTTTKTKKSTKNTKKKQSSESDDEEWYDITVPGTEGKQTVRAKEDKYTEYGHRYVTEDGEAIYV